MPQHCLSCFRPLPAGQICCRFCGTSVDTGAADTAQDPGRRGAAAPDDARRAGEDGQDQDRQSLEARLATLPEWSRNLVRRLADQYGRTVSDQSLDLTSESRWPRWLSRDYPGGEARWIAGFFRTIDAELGRLWIESGGLHDGPAWLSELSTCFQARIARVFILHGNVNDYHFHPHLGYVQLRELLLGELGPDVTFYSLSQGIELPDLAAAGEGSSGAQAGPGSPSKGRPRNDQEPLWQQVRSDFELLDRRLRGASRDGAVVVVHFVDKLFPVGAQEIEREILVEMALRWAVDPAIPENNRIVLTTTNYEGLHPDLRSRVNKVQGIEIRRPGRDARLRYILAKLFSFQTNAETHGRTLRQVGSLSFSSDFGRRRTDQAQSFAERTSGLNLMGIEDVILRAMTQNAGRLEVSEVAEHKRSLLAGESVGLLEMIEPKRDFEDVGGLQGIKDRLLEVCRGLRSQNSLVRRTLPMGILFLGPPGTGKSLVAEALAKASGLTFIKLGNFRDMYVGQSEKNLAIVLQLLRALAPVVVFVDEIDQMIGQRGNSAESGPEKRLFGKMLEFMSDTSLRGQVLWIGASNEPGGLDPAFKRPGRFDLKLPFFLPEEAGRRSIFKIMVQLKGKEVPHELTEEDFRELAGKATDGYSGAEIEMVVNEALRLAIRQDAEQVRLLRRHLDEVLAHYDPADTIRQYRIMEAEIARDIPHKDLLPARYRTTGPDRDTEAPR